MAGDRNFDDLAHRFASNVYQTTKGQVRLAVIERDLAAHCPELSGVKPLSILDAGCGKSPLATKFLAQGHNLTLVDVSVEMLKLALDDLAQHAGDVTWFHGSIQQYAWENWQGTPFDLITCHALLEWVEDPLDVVGVLSHLMHPGSKLSLLFYNIDGLIFKNLLRTNFKKVMQQDYAGSRRSLTPRYPRKINEVLNWCEQAGLLLLAHSGIRVFHDYILNTEDRNRQPDQLLALELEFSTQSPYRELGRYQHFLLEKR